MHTPTQYDLGRVLSLVVKMPFVLHQSAWVPALAQDSDSQAVSIAQVVAVLLLMWET